MNLWIGIALRLTFMGVTFYTGTEFLREAPPWAVNAALMMLAAYSIEKVELR